MKYVGVWGLNQTARQSHCFDLFESFILRYFLFMSDSTKILFLIWVPISLPISTRLANGKHEGLKLPVLSASVPSSQEPREDVCFLSSRVYQLISLRVGPYVAR